MKQGPGQIGIPKHMSSILLYFVVFCFYFDISTFFISISTRSNIRGGMAYFIQNSFEQRCVCISPHCAFFLVVILGEHNVQDENIPPESRAPSL